MNGRPNDERHFLHKTILGLGGKLLSTVGEVAGFLPGSGFARAAGSVLTSFSGRGRSRQRPPPGPRVQELLPEARVSPVIESQRDFTIGGAAGKGSGAAVFLQTGDGRGARGAPETNGVCPPRGFHLNKSSYFLRDGTFVERGSRFVRNRRLNNANGRAQDKAIVRLEKGQVHAKKLLKATGWRTISKSSSREMRNAKKKVCA